MATNESASVIFCESWRDLVTVFEDDLGSEQWLFRGQSDARWKLQPCIERRVPLGDVNRLENELVRQFKSKAHLYLKEPMPADKERLEWLTLMQHYGVPTRLLDFTYSPYVATYFAANPVQNILSERAEIWAISWRCYRSALYKSVTGLKLNASMAGGLGGRLMKDITHELASISIAFSYGRKDELNDDPAYVRPYTPLIENQRFSVQQGLFLVSDNELSAFSKALWAMMPPAEEDWLRRIQFPHAKTDEVLRGLRRMNIHELSLFPDIGGLSQFITRRISLYGGT